LELLTHPFVTVTSFVMGCLTAFLDGGVVDVSSDGGVLEVHSGNGFGGFRVGAGGEVVAATAEGSGGAGTVGRGVGLDGEL
jgi:hypothetical protein